MHWKTFLEAVKPVLQERERLTTAEVAVALGVTKNIAQKYLAELYHGGLLKRTMSKVLVETFDYKKQRKTHKQTCYVYALRNE